MEVLIETVWDGAPPDGAAVSLRAHIMRLRRGLGTEAVRRVARRLIEERGHHRITIDPATANAAAIRAYEKAGFRAVGVMRRYERDIEGDDWHDGLLMELLDGAEGCAAKP